MKHDPTLSSVTKWLQLLLNQIRGNLALRLSLVLILIVTVYMSYTSLHGSVDKADDLPPKARLPQMVDRNEEVYKVPMEREYLELKTGAFRRDSLALRLLSHSETKEGLTQKVLTPKLRSEEDHDESWDQPEKLPEFNMSAFLRDVNVHRNPPQMPIKCISGERLSTILKMKPIEFLPNYKNPCWREPIDVPLNQLYKGNGFAKYSFSYKRALADVRETYLAEDPIPTTRIRCLPYFILAGQPKCGSTDLYKRLISHPDVVSPPTKESHWWGKNRYGWCIGYAHPIPLGDYVDLYDNAALEIENVLEDSPDYGPDYHPIVTGDASVSTLWSTDDWWTNPENCGLTEPLYTNAHYVSHVMPNVKIIVILRNPTDRLYSDYLYFRDSKSTTDFHHEVSTAVNALRSCFAEMGVRACAYNATVANSVRVRLRIGLYQVYLQDWLSVFPPEQIFVLRLEDYSAHQLETIQKLYKFLDLRPLSLKENQDVLEQPKWNTRRLSDKKLGGMKNETRKLLDDFYHDFNVKLARLLKDDRFLWNDVKRKVKT